MGFEHIFAEETRDDDGQSVAFFSRLNPQESRHERTKFVLGNSIRDIGHSRYFSNRPCKILYSIIRPENTRDSIACVLSVRSFFFAFRLQYFITFLFRDLYVAQSEAEPGPPGARWRIDCFRTIKPPPAQ